MGQAISHSFELAHGPPQGTFVGVGVTVGAWHVRSGAQIGQARSHSLLLLHGPPQGTFVGIGVGVGGGGLQVILVIC
ncbi:hypothetical protein A3D77_05160 [Candidatus Gottesmanbacteria bacterium RIFCSPHIGHO2_02_FULL_39_11]|uniref:Uncharacterized protein n=1 Tax=Candidatus Gottesmanbacteria bacterium RIFCSPHIGHO2_02_FULL_39_11 TaxID=1798382 RepID=A0A1F5ZNF2_9BACT|nr:MAG: hypothetical protein A3D77_05160 [Candidatus Gottesmanbacteria bacterium RIFCSPHIGHO2_02_FULL_39_11]